MMPCSDGHASCSGTRRTLNNNKQQPNEIAGNPYGIDLGFYTFPWELTEVMVRDWLRERIWIATNGEKWGFSGTDEDWAGGK